MACLSPAAKQNVSMSSLGINGLWSQAGRTHVASSVWVTLTTEGILHLGVSPFLPQMPWKTSPCCLDACILIRNPLWTNIKKKELAGTSAGPPLLESLTNGLLGEALPITISSELVAEPLLNNPLLRMPKLQVKTPAFVGWCCPFLLGGTHH
jgi:hypothetical protein